MYIIFLALSVVYYYVLLIYIEMNNSISFKTNNNNVEPNTTETKPPRIYFNDLAKENNENTKN
jgi:hypothetical protein